MHAQQVLVGGHRRCAPVEVETGVGQGVGDGLQPRGPLGMTLARLVAQHLLVAEDRQRHLARPSLALRRSRSKRPR